LLAWRQIAAAALLAGIGVEMSRFPSAQHLARLRRGVSRQQTRTKGNYLSAKSHRLARRLGKLKAAMAVTHSLLVIIYHVLCDKKPYRDLGTDHFDSLDRSV
jgi:transposase